MAVNFDLHDKANPNQVAFFAEVMRAVAGMSKKRKFFYGGAVRGGKTSVCLALSFVFILIIKSYLKFFRVREDLNMLQLPIKMR